MKTKKEIENYLKESKKFLKDKDYLERYWGGWKDALKWVLSDTKKEKKK